MFVSRMHMSRFCRPPDPVGVGGEQKRGTMVYDFLWARSRPFHYFDLFCVALAYIVEAALFWCYMKAVF